MSLIRQQPASIRHSIASAIMFALSFGAAADAPRGQSEPQRIQAPAGDHEVTIYRDEWGVPHVYARREEDGYFGLAYAQAEDQLEKLLTIVMVVEGRSASVLGESAVTSDLVSLQWRHLEAGKKGFERLSPQLKRNLTSYTAGLRRYMEQHPEKVPAWAPRLEPWIWPAFTRGIFWDYMTQDGLRDCRAGGVELSSVESAPLQRSEQGLMASNEWVLAPWRTAGNAAMLLSDPHAEIDGFHFYEFRLHAGLMDVEGYTIGPLMLLTHNRNVAWGMTTGAPDVGDCYEVTTDASDPRRYSYDGKPQRMTVATAHVEVKGGAPVVREFEYAMQNGALAPVVGRKGNSAFVVSTSYMEAAGRFDEEMYRMNIANSTAEVRAAQEVLGMFPQNVMTIDSNGDSYYLRAGRTPRRPSGYDWSKPVPGNTSATKWLGFHPPADLVHLANPPAGYMQNNNTPPYLMVGQNQGPAAKDYPDYIYYDIPTFRYTMRGRRAVEVLSQAYAFTVEDAKALAVDEKWLGTERWLKALRAALESHPDVVRSWDAKTRQVAQRLLAFDGYAHAGSVNALNYFHWRTVLHRKLSSNDAAMLDNALAHDEPVPDAIAAELIAAIAAATQAMESAYGRLDLTYGDVFRIGRTPERSWPVGGGAALEVRRHSECRNTDEISLPCPLTLRAYISGEPDSNGRRYMTAGSRALRLVIFTKPLQAYSLHNYGQSSDPDSPHYDDQARELVSAGRLKKTHFDPESLREHVRSSVTLNTAKP